MPNKHQARLYVQASPDLRQQMANVYANFQIAPAGRPSSGSDAAVLKLLLRHGRFHRDLVIEIRQLLALFNR